MGLRETLNRNPISATAVAVAFVLVALGVMVWTNRPVATKQPSGLLHYTTDDGATWFTDSADKYPSFKTKDGKDAYRAYVYRDAEGKEFVTLIERASSRKPGEASDPDGLDASGVAATIGNIEMKRPKDTTWLRDTDPRAQTLMTPRSPSGKTEGLTFVEP